MQNKHDALRETLKNLLQTVGKPVERFLAEIEFAEGLCELHPTHGPKWRKLIDRAYELVGRAAGTKRAGALDAAVQEAEEILAPMGREAKTYTIHCVGHAHIDMNWMWSWPETVAVTNDTFLTVLKLMEEFPDFCFTQSQASVYEIARRYHPALFERIRRRVAEGRWEIAAVHWVEGDKNLAAGESLARHLLYTRRFMKEHFDLSPEDCPLDWEPDTFGHAWTIPTIVSRGGVKRYYMCRGGAEQRPPLFWWEGPDGGRILVNLEQTWYNDHISPHNTQGLLAFCRKTRLKDWMLVFGIGDHGGGPTRRDLKTILDMNAWPIYPTFRFATTKRYYEIVEAQGAKLPVVKGELNYEFTGCYTSQSPIKRNCRHAESGLREAEAAACLAWRAAEFHYPTQDLRQAWIDSLFSHFHDILPGSGVRETREFDSAMFQQTTATTGIVKAGALRALAAKVDTSFAGQSPETHDHALGAGVGRGTHRGGVALTGQADSPQRPFLVFNPNAWRREEVVSLSVWNAEADNVQNLRFAARTPDGTLLPAQRLGQGDYWGHRYVDLAVPVSVPALGYAAVVVESAGPETKVSGFGYDRHRREDLPGGVRNLAACRQSTVGNEGLWGMENDLLRVEFDAVTGGVTRLIDRTTKRDLIAPGRQAQLEYGVERPGGMTAWVIHPFHVPPRALKAEAFQPKLFGPHVASYEAKFRVNDSTFTVTYRLRADSPVLEIHVAGTWLERGGPEIGIPHLRFSAPLAVADAKGRYEIPFGSIQRNLNQGQEVPAQRWADITGKLPGSKTPAGCTLLNESKYGHSLDGSTIRLTLIRSSYDPDPLPEIGQHEFTLGLLPHGKPLSVAELTRHGMAFNQPLIPVGADVHKGRLPARAGAAEVRSDNVILACVKKAEDDDALIFRLIETAGRTTNAAVRLDSKLLGRVKQAVETDLLERPAAKSSSKPSPTGFTVQVPANGIASVKVRFTK